MLPLFLTYLLPYLTFPLTTDPLRFPAGCRKRRLNLALVFVFMLCCSTFVLIGECVLLFLLRLVFFPYQAKRLAWGNVSEVPILCRVGRKTVIPNIFTVIVKSSSWKEQEAQLSPSDRAMRLVSRNLANYHETVQKLLIRQVPTKPTTVELCISPVYRRLAVAKFSKSTM